MKYTCFLKLASCLVFFVSCSHSPEPVPEKPPTPIERVRAIINEIQTNTYSDNSAWPVYIITNRKKTTDAVECTNAVFSTQTGDQVTTGQCQVLVPRFHHTGNIEIRESGVDPENKYFKMGAFRGLTFDEWKTEIVSQTNFQIPLVFVHGFNVPFQSAVLRAAQIAYDLKYQGPVVLFSWPSGAGEGFIESKLINKTYDNNRISAQASIVHFKDVLRFFADRGLKINLLIHSMGHQVALPAVASSFNELQKSFIDELILNAPDIDVDQFQSLADSMVKASKRVTLYCSKKDNALSVSEYKNNNRRMGACELANGIDVINVGEVDSPALGFAGLGHSYYSSRAVLTDVAQLLLGLQAEKRLFIRKSDLGQKENFYLVP